MRKERGSTKEKRRRTLNPILRIRKIHLKEPQAPRRTSTRGLTRASAPSIRKETIQRNIV